MKKSYLSFLSIFVLIGLMTGHVSRLEGAPPTQLGNRSLYIFGDSWGAGIDEGVMQAELITRGLQNEVTVVPFSVGGTTMEQWANDHDRLMTKLIDAIRNDPRPDPIVFFILGGNDLLDRGDVVGLPDNFRTILTMLEASRNDLQIVFAQYDILNPTREPDMCAGIFEVFGGTDPITINTAFITLYEQMRMVGDQFERVTTVNTYGSLQGRLRDPDLSSWSPVEYLGDCIHLTEEGYGIYLDTVFDHALTPLITSAPSIDTPPTSQSIYLPTIRVGLDS